MKIAVVQMNSIVGALDKNCKAILAHAEDAKKQQADLAVFPELSLLGYPPKDLLCRADFLAAQKFFIEKISTETCMPVIFGAAIQEQNNPVPFNAAVLCADGLVQVVSRKVLLPNYNVFDEKRYFATPIIAECGIFSLQQKKLLVSICEDAWTSAPLECVPRYQEDPIKNAIVHHGPVDLIINMSASPFTQSKPKIRERIFSHLAQTYHVPVLMAGQVGANDQLLFDGHSMVIDEQGSIVSRAQPCVEDIIFYDDRVRKESSPPPSDDDLLVECLTMGIRDYVSKCRAAGVIIGISGGIDSAVCAALAVRALGSARVRGVFLPSQFTSEESRIEAQALARNLSINLTTHSIEESVSALRMLLAPTVMGLANEELVDQNLQARVRGMIIMALTNAHGDFMIATSNKSEIAVGYSTIYGDLCGAFAPIGDLYKTDVIRIAHTLNKHGIVIPPSTIARKPTAELKPNQLDSDTLPEYHILDVILRKYVDQLESAADIVQATGIARSEIDRVISMIARAEYKRRQSPFCLMVTDRVFGDAWRFPLAQQVPKLS